MTDPQPYSFGRATQQSPALLNVVERIGDRLMRRLRVLVEPLAGARPTVTARPVDRMTFEAWDACVPPFTSLALHRLHPVKGMTVLRIDAPLVALLVDRFYGGKGGAPDTRSREFTQTETRLADRLGAQVMAAVVESWSELVPMSASFVARETSTAQAEIATPATEYVVQAFDINIGGRDDWTVEIAYPAEGLCAIEALNAPRIVAEEAGAPDPVWRASLAERMDDVRLPVRTVLARPDLKMSELLALKPGDVINIHVARQLPLLIGDRLFGHGTVGEQDGRAAFLIDRLA